MKYSSLELIATLKILQYQKRNTFVDALERKPWEGREAAAPSNIKEIQEIQGGQEAPHDGDAFNPKDA